MEAQAVAAEENLWRLLSRAESARVRVIAWYDGVLKLWRCAWCDKPLISDRCACERN